MVRYHWVLPSNLDKFTHKQLPSPALAGTANMILDNQATVNETVSSSSYDSSSHTLMYVLFDIYHSCLLYQGLEHSSD